MPSPRRCPQCGRELPEHIPAGLCPSCAEAALTAGADALTAPTQPPSSLTEMPDRIGRYKILQRLGEGGCGVVYMAEQEEPVKRRVALKVIKPGMDSKQVLARFEAERQALALMDHPNIAKVLDAGATENGHPFFVMELVKGIPITRYSDQQKLPTAARLELLIQVCHAIQHAHQKGIIHRDIKPSNILVTLHDNVPVPKVIDFGIAKATGGQTLTEKTLFTAFEQFIGTPAYMSPEQAEMTPLDIDTRSDIYSLGVLAYELLTGKTPFDPQKLKEAGLNEVRRIIREEEPVRPSTRLSALKAGEQTTTALRRSSDVPRLIHFIRGDLDWIVMKALDKDRTRRYETANGLASDVKRFLSNEPVLARPQSPAYQLRKFVRRHRSGLAVATAVGLLLVAASFLSTWLALRATRAERTQRQLRQTAERARIDEAEARHKAQQKSLELAELLSQVEQQKLDAVASKEGPAKTLAYLADVLRANPDNYRAAYRLISLLSFENPARFISQRQFDAPVRATYYSTEAPLIITASTAGDVWLWDYRKDTPLAGPLKHGQEISIVNFSPSGRLFLLGLAHGKIEVWNTTNPIESVCSFQPTSRLGGANLVRFNDDETKLLTRSRLEGAAPSSSVLQLWNIPTGQALTKPIAYESESYGESFSFSEDEKSLLIRTFMRRNSTRIVDLVNEVVGPEISDPPRSFSYSSRFAYRVRSFPTGLEAGKLSLQGLLGSRQVLLPMLDDLGLHDPSTTPESKLKVSEYDVSPDGAELLALAGDRTVTLWDVGKPIPPFRPNIEPHENVAAEASVQPFAELSRDALTLLTLDRHGVLKVIRPATGQVLLSPAPPSSPVALARLSPDGQSAAAINTNGELSIWRLTDGKPLNLQSRSAASPFSDDDTPRAQYLVYSFDGSRLAVAWTGNGIELWDTHSGKSVALIPASNLSREPLLDHDGQRLAAIDDGVLRLWNLMAGSPVMRPLMRTEIGNRFASLALAFSPDGSKIAAGDPDKGVQIWDTLSGQPAAPPLQHEAKVTWVQFPSGGQFLASLCSARTFQIWDLKSATVSRRLTVVGRRDSVDRRFNPTVSAFSLSEDGRTLATQIDGELLLWDLTTSTHLSGPLSQGYIAAERLALRGDTVAIFSGSHAQILDLPRIHGPVPQWLWQLAELMGGHKTLPQSEKRTLFDEWVDLRTRILAAGPPDDVYVQWAKWFFADKRLATISPSSAETIGDYLQDCLRSNNEDRLREALVLSPLNQGVLSTYVKLRSRTLYSPDYFTANEQNVGRIRSTGRTDDALADALLGLNPHDSYAWQLKARALMQLGQLAAASDALQRSAPTEEGATFWNVRALIAEKLGKTADALDAYSQAVELARQRDPSILPMHQLQRAAFFQRQNRPAEAAADACAARGIPPRDTRCEPPLVDLSLSYTSPLTNTLVPGWEHVLSALPTGLRALGGIEFDIRGLVIPPNIPPSPDGTPRWQAISIPINRQVARLHILHGLLDKYEGELMQVAKYTVHYSNEMTEEIRIVAGENVRGVTFGLADPFEAPQAPVAWVGHSAQVRNQSARLFRLSWSNPFPDRVIQSIEFQRRSGTAFLVALTAEPPGATTPPLKSTADESMAALDQAIASQADNSDLLLLKASQLELRDQDEAAIATLQKAVTSAEVAGKRGVPSLLSILSHRAVWHLQQHRWREAANDYIRLTELRPGDHANWCALAPILVQAGEVNRYTQLRRDLLSRFGATQIDRVAERTVKAALLLPVSGKDLDEAGRLADFAVTTGKLSPWLIYFEFAQALAAYRQGNYGLAEQRAQHVLDVGGERLTFLAADCDLLLAMSKHQLGKLEDSRNTLQKASKFILENLPMPAPGTPAKNVGWNDLLTVHILLQEAEHLMSDSSKAK